MHQNHDPRRGLPSASATHRVANCPGSQALINALRSAGLLYELPDPVRTSGLRIHDWLAKEAVGDNAVPVILDNQELRTAEWCRHLRIERFNQWIRDTERYESIVEQRFWYRTGFFPRFSGQPDYVAIDRRNQRALIVNYKTGRLEAQEAADNLQLRTEVVLLKHNFPELTEITATIVEPLVSWQNESVIYTDGHFLSAEAQILEIVARTEFERDTRVAGPYCVHCPAKAHCRQAIDYVQSLPALNPEKAIVELPRGEPGVQLWERIKVAKKLIETLEKSYTRILEDEPDALPGYLLPKEGRERRYVPYPDKFKAALGAYLNPDEIDGAATFHLTKIQEIFGLKHHLEGKELEQLFTKLTKEVVSVRYDEPFIRPLRKREREAAAQSKERLGV